VIFKYQLNSGVAISVKNSAVSSPQEFRDFYSSLAYSFANGIPGITIIGEGFGIYSIAGYDTYAFLFKDPNLRDPTNPVKGMMLFRRIGYKEMSIAFGAPPESFDQQMPVVQKMIDSIKITG
jgi:hypothetical protein